MNYDVDTIFQIAGIGLIVAILHTLLKQAGKEDMAHWVTLFGFILVLIMVISSIQELFQKIKSVFLFQ